MSSAPPVTSPPTADVAPVARRGPVVEIGPERITLEGRLMGSASAIARIGRMQKVDELFTALKGQRERWKAAHPGEPFPGVATIEPHPQTSGLVLASTFQTMAYAGYPNVDIVAGDRAVKTRASIPGPPCDNRAIPCPAAPEGDHVHVQADETAWRLVVFGGETLDETSAPPVSLADFRERLADVTTTRPISTLTVHVAKHAPFSSMVPFLQALSEINDRLGLGVPVTLSVRDIADAGPPPNVPAVPAAPATGTAPVSARLDPKVIQSVVRQSFGEFRHCYEDALRKDPNAQGKVVVRFVITPEGGVSSAQAAVEGALPIEIGACMEKKFQALAFPAPDGGQVTVSYPVVFTPGG